MPTTPQGIICFYAANKTGAVASMIHPLSTAKEISLPQCQQEPFALTIDAFYGKFREAMDETPLDALILTKISDYLDFAKRSGFT